MQLVSFVSAELQHVNNVILKDPPIGMAEVKPCAAGRVLVKIGDGLTGRLAEWTSVGLCGVGRDCAN